MRARVAQATVRVWVEGRDDPCSLTVLVDPEGVDLSRPECFSPRAFMKSPSIYKRARVRGRPVIASRAKQSRFVYWVLLISLAPNYGGEGAGEGAQSVRPELHITPALRCG